MSKINDSSFPNLNCSREYSCKYYCNKFRFLIENFETDLSFPNPNRFGEYSFKYYYNKFRLLDEILKTKKFVWDQEACFGTSWYGDPVTPGNYVIEINCHANLSSNKVNIKIEEPLLISCGNKKGLKINKVTYGSDNNVVMEIENNSAIDIESVGIKKVCSRTYKTDSMKDTISEGLKAGEKKEYSFDHNCIKLNKFRAYPHECLSDRDLVYYEYDAWFDDI